ncbi:conserved membrane hypothetical protein [Bosea sp. 62]|nr:conserved membrane hypothetical protein [Bosea sp. 46]CAD5261596.1 conserved membrane hypothetical protein [Bosea sp. 21B]CAD5278973.1 conserved membrane hypothetical protein [Bosea sp. 7B]VVT58509.1 conserved membrane hypothetical protein [Bosea sp. EC-HK365B]VXB55371.1 conserved membrane hypothetical protein [Bosea sp. 29B]VXB96976.1 conserved membrane hypothetical protein [Bosea sp. 125]VXC44438.1 conserved membrane hypothetical protein [Bosea sp. 62]VXC82223.1 conserved membrane hypot
MRVLAFAGGLIAVPAIVIADVSLLMAFVTVTWRMVMASHGRTGLGQLGLPAKLKMARSVLLPVFGLLVMAAIVAAGSGLFARPQEFILGFDGIAFDQRTHPGRVWSAFVAAVVLMMVLQVDENAKPSLPRAIKEIGRHALWLVPGILLAAAVSILLHPIQGWFRELIVDAWFKKGAPQDLKIVLFFSYVLIFATIRLWLTVAILVFALRQSYRTRMSA